MDYHFDIDDYREKTKHCEDEERVKFFDNLANQLGVYGASKWFFFMNCEGSFDKDPTDLLVSLALDNRESFNSIDKEYYLEDFWASVAFNCKFSDSVYDDARFLLKDKVSFLSLYSEEEFDSVWYHHVRKFARDKYFSEIVNYFECNGHRIGEASTEIVSGIYSPRGGFLNYERLNLFQILEGVIYEIEGVSNP